MAEIRGSGTQCCGINSIAGVGYDTPANQQAIIERFDRMYGGGIAAEITLTDGQMTPQNIDFLQRNIFRLVYRFNNSNSGNVVNVFYRHNNPLSLDDLPFQYGNIGEQVIPQLPVYRNVFQDGRTGSLYSLNFVELRDSSPRCRRHQVGSINPRTGAITWGETRNG